MSNNERNAENSNEPEATAPGEQSAAPRTERIKFGPSRASLTILPDPPVNEDLKLVQVATEMPERYGAIDVPQSTQVDAAPPPEPPVQRPVSPIAPREIMPLPGDIVEWDQNFRAELPKYVGDQIREYMHIHRMTSIAFTMRLLEQFRDEEHSKKRPFYIRKEDLIGDRRKKRKSR